MPPNCFILVLNDLFSIEYRVVISLRKELCINTLIGAGFGVHFLACPILCKSVKTVQCQYSVTSGADCTLSKEVCLNGLLHLLIGSGWSVIVFFNSFQNRDHGKPVVDPPFFFPNQMPQLRLKTPFHLNAVHFSNWLESTFLFCGFRANMRLSPFDCFSGVESMWVALMTLCFNGRFPRSFVVALFWFEMTREVLCSSCSGCDDSRKSGLKYESTCIASCHQTLLHICLRSWRVRRVQFVLLNGKSLWTYSVCMALSDAKVPLAMVWSLLSYSDRRLRLWRSWKASTRRHAILFAFSNLKDRKGALTFGEWWPMMAFSGMIGQWMFP